MSRKYWIEFFSLVVSFLIVFIKLLIEIFRDGRMFDVGTLLIMTVCLWILLQSSAKKLEKMTDRKRGRFNV